MESPVPVHVLPCWQWVQVGSFALYAIDSSLQSAVLPPHQPLWRLSSRRPGDQAGSQPTDSAQGISFPWIRHTLRIRPLLNSPAKGQSRAPLFRREGTSPSPQSSDGCQNGQLIRIISLFGSSPAFLQIKVTGSLAVIACAVQRSCRCFTT